MNVVKINSTTRVSNYKIDKVSVDQLKSIIDNDLAHSIAHYIVENIDKIPAIITKRPYIEQDSEEYILTLNLISNEEIRRLRQIEDEYNIILNFQAQ